MVKKRCLQKVQQKSSLKLQTLVSTSDFFVRGKGTLGRKEVNILQKFRSVIFLGRKLPSLSIPEKTPQIPNFMCFFPIFPRIFPDKIAHMVA